MEHNTSASRSGRDRFLKTMRGTACGRPPLWEEGITDETLAAWGAGGPESPDEFRSRFPFDRHEIIQPELRPIPASEEGHAASFSELRSRFDPDPDRRLPETWSASKEPRSYPLGITISRGLLLSCGVGDWRDLERVLYAFYDEANEVEQTIGSSVQMSVSLIERVAREVELDFAIFNEPIASFHGPVLSPEHYRRFCFPHYQRLIEVLRANGVEILVVRTWGDASPLIPLWLELGLTTLWNDHCNAGGVRYTELRERYGGELRLIGGIDSRSLHGDRAAIDAAIEATAVPLLDSGGYLPLLDDRVRPEVPYAAYCYYRERLTELVEAK